MTDELLNLVREIHAATCLPSFTAPVHATKRLKVFEAMDLGKIFTPHTMYEKMGGGFMSVAQIRNAFNGLVGSGAIIRVAESHFRREK